MVGFSYVVQATQINPVVEIIKEVRKLPCFSSILLDLYYVLEIANVACFISNVSIYI